MIMLSTCTVGSCFTTCWVCATVAGLLGGFFGMMIMAMCVAARDADDRAAQFDLDHDGNEGGGANGSGKGGRYDA